VTDKRNGVPTLRAAAEELVNAIDADAFRPGTSADADRRANALIWLRAALRTDRDLSARRTRRRRGAGYAAMQAPVTPTPERGNRT
jgi:hypothetical protein